jgi:hypothetical protein
MVWEMYPKNFRATLYKFDPWMEIAAELDAYDENKIIVFNRKEPEIIWHAPGKPAKQQVQPVLVSAESGKAPIPLVSVAVIAAWGIALLCARLSPRWKAVRRRMLAVTALPLLAALLCHNVLVARVAVPWSGGVVIPNERDAVDVFISLHKNIYRAFDYKTESDIYDVLVQSVDGSMLDQVYNEVYQGLIMRDQGGAVARIQSIDVLDTKLLSVGLQDDSGDAAFRVRCRWQVQGAVSHWGHIHKRTNEYAAIYTVAQRGKAWKINGAEVLEQRRIPLPGDDPAAERLQKPSSKS